MVSKKHLFTSFIAIIFALEQIFSPKLLWAQGPSMASSHSLPLVYLNGMEIQPNGNLRFSWAIYNTNSSPNQQSLISYDKKENLAYFLTALALPDENLWVNLNITLDETAILGNGLAMTDLGKLFLQTDIQLKKDVKDIFQKKLIWNEIIDRAQDIGWQEDEWSFKPRFWIVQGKSVVLENDNIILIKQATLKIQVANESNTLNENDNKFAKDAIAVINEKVIPELEKKINSRPEYAKLRQAYRATILAQWYENKIEEGKASLFSNIKDVGRIKELWSKTLWTKREYLNQYIDLYRNAAITQDIDEWQFYSGGVVLGNSYPNTDGLKLPPDANIEQAIKGDGAGIHSQQGKKFEIDELTEKENSDKKSQNEKEKQEKGKEKSNTKFLPFLFVLVTTVLMVGLNTSPAFAASFFSHWSTSPLIQNLFAVLLTMYIVLLIMYIVKNNGQNKLRRFLYHIPLYYIPKEAHRTYRKINNKDPWAIEFFPGEKKKKTVQIIPYDIDFQDGIIIPMKIKVNHTEIAYVEGETIEIIYGKKSGFGNLQFRTRGPLGFSSIKIQDRRVVILENSIISIVKKQIMPVLRENKIPKSVRNTYIKKWYIDAIKKDFEGKTEDQIIKAVTRSIVIHELDHRVRGLHKVKPWDKRIEEDLADLRAIFQGEAPFYTLIHLLGGGDIIHPYVAIKLYRKVFGEDIPTQSDEVELNEELFSKLAEKLFSMSKERLREIAKDVYTELRKEIEQNNRKSYFNPFVKHSGTPIGKPIGEGIELRLYKKESKINNQLINILKNSGILGNDIDEKNLQKKLPGMIDTLQTYFEYLLMEFFRGQSNRLLPKTIELRKDVRPYVAFVLDDTNHIKIIVDIGLLIKLNKEELITVLNSILSAEVFLPDQKKLSVWNNIPRKEEERQQKLISALRKLGHSEEQLEKYIAFLIDKTGIVSKLNELEQTLLKENPDSALTGAMTILDYIQDVAKTIKDGKIGVENISSQSYTSADVLNMFSGAKYYSEILPEILDILQKMGYDNPKDAPLPVIVAVLLQKDNIIIDSERAKELEEVYKFVAIQLLTDKDAADQYIEAIKKMNKGLSPSNDQDDLGGISFASLELKTISVV